MFISDSQIEKLFPDVGTKDIQILQRVVGKRPEVFQIMEKFQGDFKGLISLLRNNSTLRGLISEVKEELTEELKLPSWFGKTASATEITKINKAFEKLSVHYRSIADVTEKANIAYNSVISEAHDHADKVRAIYEEDSIFILRMKSTDLTGIDNTEFVLFELDEQRKLSVQISNGVSAHVPILGKTVDFSQVSVDERSSLKKKVRNKIMDKFREKYYTKVIVEGDQEYSNHIRLVKSMCMGELVVPKTLRKQV
jgi:hypothetical protein